jgi:hypothetical protein
MKKIIFPFLFLFISTISFAQKDSTFCGKWQISVNIDGKTKSTTYMLLSRDSTFITSNDSTFSNYSMKASQGKWKVSPAKELILIPADTSRETHYYKNISEGKYIYSENEKNGVRSPVQVMEIMMEVYIEKLNPSSSSKSKGKKKKKK